MTSQEYKDRQQAEDERFGFILSYYNGKFSRTYEKRFTTRSEMNEFIERNHPGAYDVRRFEKIANAFSVSGR
jgi:hypothetical protein